MVATTGNNGNGSMSPTDTIDSIVQQAKGLFPRGDFSREVEKNFRALLQSQLRKLDLVSRDEFDAQVEVLRRSREKIDRLEQQLQELLEQRGG